MKVRYDATGSDLVPNKDFWTSLPFLVKVSVTYYTREYCTSIRTPLPFFRMAVRLW